MTRSIPPSSLRSGSVASAAPFASVGTRNSTTLARLLSLFFVFAVGRVGDLFPRLEDFPFAKVIAVLAILAALRDPNKAVAAGTWKSIPPARLIIAFMGIAVASFLYSVHHAATFNVIKGTVLAVVVTLVLAIKASRDWASVRTMLYGLVIASVVLVILAFRTQYAGRAGYTGSYDPNDFAFVLVGLLPVVFTFGIVSRGAKRYAYLSLVGLMILAILLTESRGGFLGLICDIFGMTFLMPIARRGSLEFRTSRSKLLARAALLVLVGVASWYLLPDPVRARLDSITSLGSDYNLSTSARGGRMAIWTRNLPLVLDRPWGYGAGAFDTVDGLFAGGLYRAPHNTFLEALVELGIPGLVVLIAVIVSSIRYLHPPPRLKPDHEPHVTPDEPRAFARAIGIGLIGLCVSGFFLSELYASVLWTFVTLSCAVGSVRRGLAPAGGGGTQTRAYPRRGNV